eukprot:gene12539-14501_t
MEKGKPNLLLLVVDIESLLNSVTSRVEKSDADTISSALQQSISGIVMFCNCYALMHRQNQLSVICSLSESIRLVFPSTSTSNKTSFQPLLHTLSEQIATGLKEAMDDQIHQHSSRNVENFGMLSQSMSTALSIINRHKHLQSRILVLQFERDRNQNYNAVMNSIFSAQKMNVMVDALVLASFDSHILQQACFLTGGTYMKHADKEDLLQLLTTHFLADVSTRAHLATPQQKSVDFKASCHCHKRPVEFAFMCSVCLTLTCQVGDSCVVCGTTARGSSIGS